MCDGLVKSRITRDHPPYCNVHTVPAKRKNQSSSHPLNVHRDDIHSVILLMPHRRGIVPQQPERSLSIVRDVWRLTKIGKLILEIFGCRSRNELQFDLPAHGVSSYYEPSRSVAVGCIIRILQQTRQGLLANENDTILACLVPTGR